MLPLSKHPVNRQVFSEIFPVDDYQSVEKGKPEIVKHGLNTFQQMWYHYLWR